MGQVQGVTGQAELDDTHIAQYIADYYEHVEAEQCWNQFCQQKGDPGGSGDVVTFFFVPGFDPISTALSERADVVPLRGGDVSKTITMYEYGNAVQLSAMGRVASYIDIEQATENVLANNFLDSWERLCRTPYVAGNLVYRQSGEALRTSLDATNDLITWEYLTQLKSFAKSLKIPSFPDGTYASVIPPVLEGEVMNLSEWKGVAEYSEPNLIWEGKMTDFGGKSFRGEVGQVCGIRFCVSNRGKIYLSGGTLAQAATTLNGAVAAGATSVTVTSATGILAGDFITIGTLEAATAEQVQVTNVAGAVLTILGVGDEWTSMDNLGLKYAHADLTPVTEAANVAAVPIIGPSSMGRVYNNFTGPYAKVDVGPAAGAVIPERFLNFSWWWIGGYGLLSERWMLRGECAVKSGYLGNN